MISGCSYTADSHWPAAIWPHHDIINLGRSGAGNRYITDSIIKSIDLHHPPHGVFVLLASVNRSDIIVPRNAQSESFAKQYPYHGVIDDSIYFFSGGDKYNALISRNYNNVRASSWPEMQNCGDFLDLPSDIKQECLARGIPSFGEWDFEQFMNSALMLHYLPSQSFLQNQTYHAIFTLQTFLERYHIPYAFGFTYNLFDSDYSRTYGNLDKRSAWYDKIKWDRWIDVFPLEIGLEHDLFLEDGVHLRREAQEIWANKVSRKIHKEIDHDKSFF